MSAPLRVKPRSSGGIWTIRPDRALAEGQSLQQRSRPVNLGRTAPAFQDLRTAQCQTNPKLSWLRRLGNPTRASCAAHADKPIVVVWVRHCKSPSTRTRRSPFQSQLASASKHESLWSPPVSPRSARGEGVSGCVDCVFYAARPLFCTGGVVALACDVGYVPCGAAVAARRGSRHPGLGGGCRNRTSARLRAFCWGWVGGPCHSMSQTGQSATAGRSKVGRGRPR